MPVNWAFPAAQGEPESFLTIWVQIYCLQRVFDGAGFLAAQNFFRIRKSILGSTC